MEADDVVIVGAARTPIGKYGGGLRRVHPVALGATAAKAALTRAGIDAASVDEVWFGHARQAGSGPNPALQVGHRAGLPHTVPAQTVNKACASGLQAISTAAHRVTVDGVPVALAGGLESISLVQNDNQNNFRSHEDWLDENKPELYLPMIDTAEVVAKRYNIIRETQDEYGLQSQLRTAAAQQAGRFDDEIAPMTTTKIAFDKKTGESWEEEVTLENDEGNRPTTTLDGLAGLEPVRGEQHCITAGNASQLSDGASACIIMDSKLAEKRGLQPLGIYRGLSVAGCEPDEMGVGPVYAVPKLLARQGLKVKDIDLWELNEAFAVQVLFCRDRLGIDPEKLNVNGGSISLGHPFGMTGSRLVGTLAYEMNRRAVRFGVVTMCVGGGQGAAALFERCS